MFQVFLIEIIFESFVMATVDEKVNCVLWLAELKSVTAVRQRLEENQIKKVKDAGSITLMRTTGNQFRDSYCNGVEKAYSI